MLSVVPENLQSELVSLERWRALYSERLVWGGEGEQEVGRGVRRGNHTRAKQSQWGETGLTDPLKEKVLLSKQLLPH